MAAIKGSDVVLKVGNGDGPPETFTVLAGARGVEVSLGGDELDTTTADDIAEGVTWRTYISGIADLSITFDGVIKDKASFNQIMGDRLTDTIRNYRVEIIGFGVFAGPGRVTTSNPSAQFDQVASFSVSIRASGAWTYTAETSAPSNTLLPSISGVAQVGEVLTAMEGVWSGGGIAYTYQWQTDQSGSWANISGATARAYTPVVGNATHQLRVIVTATNSAGSASATSAPTADVLAA